jgi:hypothetical protein
VAIDTDAHQVGLVGPRCETQVQRAGGVAQLVALGHDSGVDRADGAGGVLEVDRLRVEPGGASAVGVLEDVRPFATLDDLRALLVEARAGLVSTGRR